MNPLLKQWALEDFGSLAGEGEGLWEPKIGRVA